MTKGISASRLFPKKVLVAYFFGMLIILVGSSLVVMVGLAQVSAVNYAVQSGTSSNNSFSTIALPSRSPFVNGTVITDQYSRSVYTSWVPETIVGAINALLNSSSAFPMTISLASVNSSYPLVFRGLPPSVLPESLRDGIIGGNWTILGSEAAKELNAHVGTIFFVASPLSGYNGTFSLTVTGIYNVEGETSYEALVPISLGEKLSGLSPGVVNAIVAPPGIDTANLRTLVTSNYFFTLRYNGAPGTLDIVDSSGYLHSTMETNGTDSKFNTSLPFGLYTLVLSENGVKTVLDQFVPTKNGTIINATSSTQTGSNESLYVKNDSPDLSPTGSPKLIGSKNQTILPTGYNQTTGYWLFRVNGGSYTIESADGSIAQVLVVGNTTYDQAQSNLTRPNSVLHISISSGEESAGSTYSITIKDLQTSNVIFSTLTSQSSLSVPVELNHTYTASVQSSATELLEESNVSVSQSTQSLSFIFPAIPINPGSVPVSGYSSLGIGVPSKSGSFDFLIGGVAATTVALFAIVFSLLFAASFVLSKQFLIALRKELKALRFIFPTRSSVSVRIHVPMLVVPFGAIFGAILISYSIFVFLGLDNALTFLGYGIQNYPLLLISPVIIAFALVSYLKVLISMDREIFF